MSASTGSVATGAGLEVGGTSTGTGTGSGGTGAGGGGGVPPITSAVDDFLSEEDGERGGAELSTNATALHAQAAGNSPAVPVLVSGVHASNGKQHSAAAGKQQGGGAVGGSGKKQGSGAQATGQPPAKKRKGGAGEGLS